MWRCPTCGQTFVTRNMPHSCQVVALGDHFAGSDLRPVFDEEEWKVLNVQLDQVRGMRQWVEQMEGKIEEDPNNPAPAVAF